MTIKLSRAKINALTDAAWSEFTGAQSEIHKRLADEEPSVYALVKSAFAAGVAHGYRVCTEEWITAALQETDDEMSEHEEKPHGNA